MRLRQRLFTAILAAMVVMFLLLALVSSVHGLTAQRTRRALESAVARAFRDAVASGSADGWRRFGEEFAEPGVTRGWQVTADGVILAGDEAARDLTEMAREGGHVLLVSRSAAGLEPVSWLSSLFWAVAAGTAFLLLVVYGLLLRLVLRPVENLVAASRSLSSGSRPGKVPGESRTDEMGELVRAFNRMASEVTQSREELERRVEEAVREHEKAQRRLVLEQRLSATGKLAAGVAHEIANPLGGMMNAARSIEKEPGLSERGREYVGLVNDGLGRIEGILERMRAFVRPKPSVGPVDLAEAAKGALAFARHRIREEGVALEEAYPDAPVRAAGSAGELQQVLLNLVVNALDAMRDSEEKRLTVRVAERGARAVVEVADSGVGMSEEQLANAFDLFYSAKGEGGTGLGLAVAHRIVADHGGEIELESSPGEGTTARVGLPLEAGGPAGRVG